MALLKDAIKALDPVQDKKTELTLALSLITELAENKAAEFEKRVQETLRTAGSVENRTIPVTEIIASHREYRAYVQSDAGKIASEVSGAVKKFVSGGTNDIIDGVSSLVTTAVEALIGGGSASQQEMMSYYIVVQDYGIVRYDICAWSRSVEARGITSQIECALAFQATKSSVDVTKLSYNTFLIAYGQQLSNMGFSDTEIEKYLEYAEKIYDKLRGIAGVPTGRQALDEQYEGFSIMKMPGVLNFA